MGGGGNVTLVYSRNLQSFSAKIFQSVSQTVSVVTIHSAGVEQSSYRQYVNKQCGCVSIKVIYKKGSGPPVGYRFLTPGLEGQSNHKLTHKLFVLNQALRFQTFMPAYMDYRLSINSVYGFSISMEPTLGSLQCNSFYAKIST